MINVSYAIIRDVFFKVGQEDDELSHFNITPGQACTSKDQGIYNLFFTFFFNQVFTQLEETLL